MSCVSDVSAMERSSVGVPGLTYTAVNVVTIHFSTFPTIVSNRPDQVCLLQVNLVTVVAAVDEFVAGTEAGKELFAERGGHRAHSKHFHHDLNLAA